MYLWIVGWRICCQTCWTDLSNALMSCGGWRAFTFLLIKSQMCSIGFRSGDFAGQGITRMLFNARNCWVVLALWQGALSCAKTMPLFLAKCGRRTGLRMSFWYLAAVSPPLTRISGVFVCIDTPPHTIRLPPPPNLSISSTQASLCRSPRRRYTLFLPSALCSFILVSSTNKTFAQSALVSLRCLLAHARRAIWCRQVNNKTLLGRLACKRTSLRRFRTVCDDMERPWVPFVSLAVWVAGLNLSRKWFTTM